MAATAPNRRNRRFVVVACAALLAAPAASRAAAPVPGAWAGSTATGGMSAQIGPLTASGQSITYAFDYTVLCEGDAIPGTMTGTSVLVPDEGVFLLASGPIVVEGRTGTASSIVYGNFVSPTEARGSYSVRAVVNIRDKTKDKADKEVSCESGAGDWALRTSPVPGGMPSLLLRSTCTERGLRARVTGPGTEAIRRVTFYAGRKRVGGDRRAPFARRLGFRSRTTRVRVRVALKDGRATGLTKKVKPCSAGGG